MTDRSQAPAYKQVGEVSIIPAKEHRLNNNIPVYYVNAGEQELLRLEFIFENGLWDTAKPLQAYVVNSMLNDGTEKLTAAQIAEQVDFYGAFLQTDYNYDQSTVALYTLNKHLDSVLPILQDIICNSVFPQRELDLFARNQKQKLSVSLEKNDFVGRRLFNHALFGDTLYGYNAGAEDYDRLERSQLLDYYSRAYQPANCTIVAAGKIGQAELASVNRYFGGDWAGKQKFSPNTFGFEQKPAQQIYQPKQDALQSAIRLGSLSINRLHPDFPALQVVNTILGGYFGSRLMANIREDKGYTYGIGSALVSLKNAGYLFVASEVGADVCTDALKEIYAEIQILQTLPVEHEELMLVQNYMMGSMLGSLENAFSHADKFKNIHFYGLGYDYYDRYIETIKTIDPVRIQQLARQYLDISMFQEVVVGQKTVSS